MSRSADLTIGSLAAQARTTTPTIRYYESIGLLPAAARRGGHRRYSPEDVRRLTFVRRCREFGFTIEDVRALLGVMQDRARRCDEARDIAQAHAEIVHAKIAELRALERTIRDLVRGCDQTCLGGPGAECVPFQRLAHRERTLDVTDPSTFGVCPSVRSSSTPA